MKKTRILMLIIVLVTLLTASCRTSRVSETQVQLLQYSLKKSDLPGFGWSVETEGWGADYGGENYGIVFIRDKHVFVSHTVEIHSSEDQAQRAYKEWETKWFDITNLQPEIYYDPIDQGDDYRMECFQMKPDDPLIVCIYLQRHNTLINFVKVNLDYRSRSNLTFEEIIDILTVLDKRLNEVVVE